MSTAMPRRRAPRPYHHGNLAPVLAEAAEGLLREVGYPGFSLRECARRAGVAHSAPGHHYRDVRGLLTEVAARGFERLTASMIESRGDRCGTEALKACGRGYVAFALADPVIFDLLFQQPQRIDHGSQRLREAGAAAFQQLEISVELARSGRPRRDADLRFAWSTVHGYANLAIGGEIDPAPPCRESSASGQVSLDEVLERVVLGVTS